MNFSNASFTTNASAPVDSTATSAAVPGVIITVAVLGIVGNLLVLSVTARRQTFPSAARLFVASMAWSDLIHGLTLPSMVAPAEAGEWVYSDRAAKATAAIGVSCLQLSAFALAGLTLDRHYALRNDGVGISRKKARIFLISAWVGIYAWYISCTVYGVPVYYDTGMAVTAYDIKAHMWFTIVVFGAVCTPLVITMYCVVRILVALCTQHEPPAAQVIVISVNGPGGPPQNLNPQQQPQNNPQQQPQNNPQQQPQNPNSDRSYAKVVLVLTLVQVILQLPSICAFIASQMGYDLPTFLFWSYWLALCNIFLDVFVYSVFHKSFRRVVKEIATSVASYLYDKCCPKNRVDNDDQQNIQMSSL
ncbi:beta-3 adrenergic receptor-like [Branchiostoma floridae]|uniref:Beta-3 adrenergic receptor-like n=1 Tax=Branchiostoma floridae TaxID=7739 RepID=A0A9J7HH90_BRAFL|nr:beta-3 adrenergic receptor-like [Branchiostoma floridae]